MVFDGNLMVGAAEGLGGRAMRTVSFFGLLFGSSSSPKAVAAFGPHVGGGGGTLACGLAFSFISIPSQARVTGSTPRDKARPVQQPEPQSAHGNTTTPCRDIAEEYQ